MSVFWVGRDYDCFGFIIMHKLLYKISSCRIFMGTYFVSFGVKFLYEVAKLKDVVTHIHPSCA